MILGVIGCGKMAKAIVSEFMIKNLDLCSLLVNDIDDGCQVLWIFSSPKR